MLLLGKSGGINEQEQGGGKVNEKGDYDPEILGIIHIKNRGVFYLFIKEENAVNNDKNGFQRSGC
jgi:hypothetical protein